MKTRIFKSSHCLPLLAASLLMASTAHAEPPVKVYILAGQSNMQGKGGIEGDGGTTTWRLSKGFAMVRSSPATDHLRVRLVLNSASAT